MDKLFIFSSLLLAGWGLSWTLGRAKISFPMRQRLGPGYLLDLLECPGCTGFWIGLAYGFILHLTRPDFFSGLAPEALIAFGQAGFNAFLGAFYDKSVLEAQLAVKKIDILEEPAIVAVANKVAAQLEKTMADVN